MKKFVIENPRDVLAIVARRKWWFGIIAMSGLLLTGLTLVLLPKIYVSSTLVLIEPRDIPEDMVRDLIVADTQQRLAAIQETVLSRTNLLRILNEFADGFEGLEGMNSDRQVETLRSRINIEVATDRRAREISVLYFRISYQDRDPRFAQRITSRLASLFIEHDARSRETRVFGTVDFLRNEVEKVSNELETVESALRRLKERYQYELPSHLDTNLRTLDRLQESIKTNAEAHDRYVSIRLDLQRQLSEVSPVIVKEARDNAPRRVQREKSRLVVEYERKQDELRQLKARYTERHPDVLRLKSELEQLRSEIPPEDFLEIEESALERPSAVTEPNPAYQQLNTQLAQVNTELRVLRDERQWLETEISKHNARVQNTPQREQEISVLQRQFDNLSLQHNDLRDRLTEAQLAESLETRKKGEQFQVIDAASLPMEPSKPNRALIFVLGILGSLALAGGAVAAVDFIDQRVWSYREVEQLLGVPVIAEIPEIVSEKDLHLRKKEMRWKVAAYAAFCFACVIAVYLVYATPGIRSAGSEQIAKLLNW